MQRVIETDVAVVGAGSAGSAAAFCLAGTGLRVTVLEARALDASGARWSDDFPPWLFDRAGIARPEPPEARNRGVPYRLFGWNGGRVELDRSPMWAVDVPRLTARLQAGARERGATFVEHATLHEVRCDAAGRPIAVVAHVRAGGAVTARAVPVEVRARLFVDASGLAGEVRRRVPAMDRDCPVVDDADLCHAAQYVCEVKDRAGAAAFLENLGVEPGHFCAWTGIDGGFSTRVVHVDADLSEVAILTGIAWDGRNPGARRLMQDLRREQPWIGKAAFGGEGLIPIRRPYERLAAAGIALIGDAGCQVVPPTGCGIGGTLVAARMLADAVTGRDDPGGIEATWAYQAAFQHERGGVHAAYDQIRRLAQSLTGPESSDLVRFGIVTRGSLRSVMDQRMPDLGPSDLASTAMGAAKVPHLAARMAAVVLRMFAVRAAHAFYPKTPDEPGLRAWSRRVATLAGHVPGVS